MANDAIEPTLIGVTPKFPLKEQCEVKEVKECGVGGTQFVCLDAKVTFVRLRFINFLWVKTKILYFCTE